MICPFLELGDPHCANHFSLTNLSDTFSHCVGRYQSCPAYNDLLGQRDKADRPAPRAAQPLVPNRLAG